MKKVISLLGIMAGVILAVAIGAGSVRAEAHDNHCICGGNGTCIATAAANGHTADTPTEWVALDSYTTFDDLTKSSALAVGAHIYLYLTQDVTFTATPERYGRHIHICLYGHTLKTAANKGLIYVGMTNGNAGSLTICDCQGGGLITRNDSTTTGKAAAGGIISIANSTVLELFSGTISGGIAAGTDSNPAGAGGNIAVRTKSIFNMYGGAITGGKARTWGGNVEVNGTQSTFNMYGGTISGGEPADGKNSGTYGGNIAVYDKGTFNLYGGTITAGKSGTYGGNVALAASSTFVMEGGTISDGKSGSYGGNVVLNSASGSITMNGGEIKDGTSTTSGGNVYNAGTFTMNGGAIADGTATTHGGNVATEKPMTMNGGEISGGKATTYGGNVSVTTNGTFTLNGGLSKDGKANTYAGNVAALGTFIMKGGEIKDGEANCDKTSNNGKDSGGNIFVSKTATIEGGKLTGGKAYRGGNINVGGVGTLTISGTAEITGGESETDGALISVAGELIIEGGFFTGANTEGFAIVTYKASEDVSGRSDGIMSIKISGGVFDGTGDMIGTIDGGTLEIDGGIFKKTVHVLKGNGIIKDGIFGDKVAVGMTEDDEADGTLELSGGFFTLIPEAPNKGFLVYGGLVLTADATPDAAKPYFVRTDVQVGSNHSYYTYEEVTGLAAFEEGKEYAQILGQVILSNFEKENEFENATGTQEILKTFYRAGGMS